MAARKEIWREFEFPNILEMASGCDFSVAEVVKNPLSLRTGMS